MKEILDVIELIDRSIKFNPENSITAWEIIADGYDEQVDQYREAINCSQEWLIDYQNKISDETDISNLKIKYTNASWYFIEVPKSQTSKIPNSFIHKQTLVNASRYITVELKELEQKIIEAQTNKSSREYEIFLDIREKILDKYSYIKNASDICSNIDFISSLSQVAYNNNYIKPDISDNYDIDIVWWRHPIIEKSVTDFISNDLNMSKKSFVHVITWPNMWGKSTFLRQNALIILMSHIGSFVPAKQAKIPLTDNIFSRIGASDNLFLGQSTFMVEMQEVANILNNSTKNSFVIIDEVGRWTSTYDGMSLAWAILKQNHDKINAKTLFATHYHELIDESSKLKWVKNFSVAVWENEENLVFLRKVVEWWIKKSFWLEVARIAWLGDDIINEAKNMLNFLESEHSNTKQQQLNISSIDNHNYTEKIVYRDSEVLQKINKMDINNMTPIEAFNELYKIKNQLDEKK